MADITRDDEDRRYFLTLRSQMAYIPFVPLTNNRVLFVSTFVPKELRGQGLAERLCKFAFTDAKNRGLLVLSSCSYIISKFIPENPEFAPIFDSISKNQSDFLLTQEQDGEDSPIDPSSTPTQTKTDALQLKSNRLPKGFKFTLLPHHHIYGAHWERVSDVCNRTITNIDQLFDAFSYIYQESFPGSSIGRGKPFPRGSASARVIEPLCRYLGKLPPAGLDNFFKSILPVILQATLEFPQNIQADCNWGDSTVIPVLCHLDFSSTALPRQDDRSNVKTNPYGFSVQELVDQIQSVVRQEVQEMSAIISHNTNQPHIEPSVHPNSDSKASSTTQEDDITSTGDDDQQPTSPVAEEKYPCGFFFAPCMSKLVLSRKTVMGLLASSFFGLPSLSSIGNISRPLSTVFAPELFDSCGIDRFLLSNIYGYTTSPSVHAKLSSILSYFTYFKSYASITGSLEYIWTENVMNVDFVIDQLLGRQRFRNDLFLKHRSSAGGAEPSNPIAFESLPQYMYTPVTENISNLPDIIHQSPGTTRKFYTPLPKMFTVDEYTSGVSLYDPSRYSHETRKALMFSNDQDSPFRRWLYGDACRQAYLLLLKYSRVPLVGTVIGTTTGDSAKTYTNTGVLRLLDDLLPRYTKLLSSTPAEIQQDVASGVEKCLTTPIPTTFNAFTTLFEQMKHSPDSIIDDFRYLSHDRTYNVREKMMHTAYPSLFQSESPGKASLPPPPSLAREYIDYLKKEQSGGQTQPKNGDVDATHVDATDTLHQLHRAIASGSTHGPSAFKVESVSNEHLPTSLLCDFANKYIGGTVLTTGCVQEEIVFVEHAETLISLLFTSVMTPTAAVKILGSVKHGVCGGYAGSLFFSHSLREDDCESSYASSLLTNQSESPCASLFTKEQQEQQQLLQSGIKTASSVYGPYPATCILAIDAEPYGDLTAQFTWNKIRRELTKLLSGLSVTYSYNSYDSDQHILSPISSHHFPTTFVTGNWGAGVFGGCPQLKSVFQWLACGISDVYYRHLPMGDRRTAGLHALVHTFYQHKVRVCDAFIALLLMVNGTHDYFNSSPVSSQQIPNMLAVEKLSELLLLWYGSTLRLKSRWFLLDLNGDQGNATTTTPDPELGDNDSESPNLYDSPIENPIGPEVLSSCYTSTAIHQDAWKPFVVLTKNLLSRQQSPVYSAFTLFTRIKQDIVDSLSATVPL